MEIKREDILHLASLSNLTLSESEVESLGRDLRDIIKYISLLDELDVSDMDPTYQVTELENVWREDEVIQQDADREELLALAKDTKDNQVEVPQVL